MRSRAPMPPSTGRNRRCDWRSLAALRHPYSIDLYCERVCAQAKLIVARVLGGADYWRYGVDELAALARRRGIKLALLPGDRRADQRLEAASTLDAETLNRIWRYFDEGGPDNLRACLAYLAGEVGGLSDSPAPVAAFGRFEAACREGAARRAAGADRLLSLDLSGGGPRADRGNGRGARRPGLFDDGRLCDEPEGRGRACASERHDRAPDIRRRAERDRLLGAARRPRRDCARRDRRAGASGCAGRLE